MLFDRIKGISINEAGQFDSAQHKRDLNRMKAITPMLSDIPINYPPDGSDYEFENQVMSTLAPYKELRLRYSDDFNKAPEFIDKPTGDQLVISAYKYAMALNLRILYVTLVGNGIQGDPGFEGPVWIAKNYVDNPKADPEKKKADEAMLKKRNREFVTIIDAVGDLKCKLLIGSTIKNFDSNKQFGFVCDQIEKVVKDKPVIGNSVTDKEIILDSVLNFGRKKYADGTSLLMAYSTIRKEVEDSKLSEDDKNILYALLDVENVKIQEILANDGKLESDDAADNEPIDSAAVEGKGGIDTYTLTGLELSSLSISVTTFMTDFTNEMAGRETTGEQDKASGYGLTGMLRSLKMTMSDLVGYDMQSGTAAVINSYSSTRKAISNAMKKGAGVGVGALGIFGGWEGMKKMYKIGENMAGIPLKEFMESNPEDLNTHLATIENKIRPKFGLPPIDIASDVYMRNKSRWVARKYSEKGADLDTLKRFKNAPGHTPTGKQATPNKPTTTATKPGPTHTAQTFSTPKKNVNASLEYNGTKLFEEGMAMAPAEQPSASNFGNNSVISDTMTPPSRQNPVTATGLFGPEKKKRKKMKSMKVESLEDVMSFDDFINEYYQIEEEFDPQIGNHITTEDGRSGIVDRLEDDMYVVIDDNDSGEFKVSLDLIMHVHEGEVWNTIKSAIGNFFKGMFSADYEGGANGISGLIASPTIDQLLVKGDVGVVDPKDLQSMQPMDIINNLFKKAGGGRYLNELINQLKLQMEKQIADKSTMLTVEKQNARKKAADKAIAANLKILKDKANAAGDIGLAAQVLGRKANAEDFVAKADQILTKHLVDTKAIAAKEDEAKRKAAADVIDAAAKKLNDPNQLKLDVDALKNGKGEDIIKQAYGESTDSSTNNVQEPAQSSVQVAEPIAKIKAPATQIKAPAKPKTSKLKTGVKGIKN